MRNGLLKGAETMKANAKKYPFTCPVCGKTTYHMKHIAESKKFCSHECAAIGGNWQLGVKNSAIASHNRNLERKEIMKQDIISWVLENKSIVLNCPYNKITPTLKDLMKMVEEKHNVIDIRSIYLCFNVKNTKTLLDELKKVIYASEENVC